MKKSSAKNKWCKYIKQYEEKEGRRKKRAVRRNWSSSEGIWYGKFFSQEPRGRWIAEVRWNTFIVINDGFNYIDFIIFVYNKYNITIAWLSCTAVSVLTQRLSSTLMFRVGRFYLYISVLGERVILGSTWCDLVSWMAWHFTMVSIRMDGWMDG